MGLLLLLPMTFLWMIQLKEQHPGGIDYSQSLYYWDYSCSPFFCTRQENNVVYSAWRVSSGVDVPWNVFYGWNGNLSASYVDLSAGQLVSRALGPYTNDFWPRDLTKACEKQSEGVTLPDEFGGRFRDGTTNATLFQCALAGTSMQLFSKDGQVIRVQILKKVSFWEPQIWDVIEQKVFDTPLNRTFLKPHTFEEEERRKNVMNQS